MTVKIFSPYGHSRCVSSTSVEASKVDNIRLCECGCELSVKKGNRFIRGHNTRDNNNPNWKDNNAGNRALHVWVRKHLPKSDLCQECNKITKKLDLANITGVYNRDLSNWKYLCRKCHHKVDLQSYILDMSDRICSVCQDTETHKHKKNGRPHWKYSKITGELLCTVCYQNEWNIVNTKWRQEYYQNHKKQYYVYKRNRALRIKIFGSMK